MNTYGESIKEEKTAHVLIVEDERELRESLAEILELEGLQVTQVPNGFQAIEEAQQSPFDIVLIDLKMPGINGLETLKRIKSLKPDIKAIIMTGHSVEGIPKSAFHSTAGLLFKPFYIKDLIKMIHQLTFSIA